MSKKIKISKLSEFDMAEHLDDERAVAVYLTVVMEENDPSALAQALGTVARARDGRNRQGRGIGPRSAVQGAASRCPAALRYRTARMRRPGCALEGGTGLKRSLHRHAWVAVDALPPIEESKS